MTDTYVLPALPDNPAKFSPQILDVIREQIQTYNVQGVALDPFAGTGRVHQLAGPGLRTVGVEIEPEWAAYHPDTRCGDSRKLMSLFKPGESFDAIITSPTYGNRMADHHEAKDDSVRNTYRHKLGRMPSEGSTAVLQWGEAYRELHKEIYRACHLKLNRDAVVILNVKDHVRGGEVVQVSEWHKLAWAMMGWTPLDTIQVPVTGNGYGANGKARVPHEDVHVMRRL